MTHPRSAWTPTVQVPTDPTTLHPLPSVTPVTRAELVDTVSAAAAAFAGRWSRAPHRRSQFLTSWAEAVEADTEGLIADLVRSTGKTVAEAGSEVAAAVTTLRYNATLVEHLASGRGALIGGRRVQVLREPVGPSAVIVPWNWPLLLVVREVAPALAAGVTVVVKPDPQGQLVTDRLLGLAARAGLDTGVLSIVAGGAEVGRALVANPRIRAVAFTGSTRTGREVLRQCADHFTRPLLELGGKGTALLCADADLDTAVSTLADSAVVTAGQMCLAVRRVLVPQALVEEVAGRLAGRFATMSIGDPRSADTSIGPVRDPHPIRRILDDAVGSAEVIGGRVLHPSGLEGHFVEPAVVVAPPTHSAAVQDEVFGPVVTVEGYVDEGDGVRLANATPYGLVASVWSGSRSRSLALARRIEAGTVWVDDYGTSLAQVPSGGFKHSGLGRTRGTLGLEQFGEVKSILEPVDLAG